MGERPAPGHPLRPDWAAPAGALITTRPGGVSRGPYATLNLGMAVGDDPQAVTENRRRVAAWAGMPVVWLRQVHGVRVVQVGTADADAPPIEADAVWTDAPGVAIAIQVADCLPVLLAAPDGRVVAAAHAGWRGLAGGVLEATLAALCERADCKPDAAWAWLGPCIGPAQFEVGADVLQAFGRSPADAAPARFSRRDRPDGSARWLADLPGLAADRLRAAGVSRIAGGTACTVSDPSRFFSYRRDGVTGRFAAVVWRDR